MADLGFLEGILGRGVQVQVDYCNKCVLLHHARQGRQKHFNFGHAKYGGDIVGLCRGFGVIDYPREVWKFS